MGLKKLTVSRSGPQKSFTQTDINSYVLFYRGNRPKGLREKALYITTRLGIKDSTASIMAGWLDRFKNKYSLVQWQIYGAIALPLGCPIYTR